MKKPRKKVSVDKTNIALDAPIHATLKQFAEARGMVLRIATERAILAGIRALSEQPPQSRLDQRNDDF